MLHRAPICMLLLCSLLGAAEATSRTVSLERFSAELVACVRVAKGSDVDYLPCDRDPRFIITLRHDDGSEKHYGIHSARRTFMGRARVGERYRFALVRYAATKAAYLYLCRNE